MAYQSSQASAAIATATTTTLVAAVANATIKVYGVVINCGATAGSVTIKDSDGTPLLGPLAMPATSTIVLPLNDQGWLQTSAGSSLQVVTTSTGPTFVAVNYTQI
jgi:hypothetical protein